MDTKKKKELEQQGYRFVGNHSAIKVCEYCRESLRDKDQCYKEEFYGIDSHAMHRTYVVSRYSLDAMLRIGADARRLAVLPPAIDLDEYRPLQGRERWPNDFVYASSCTVWKGVEDVVEAMRLVKQTWPDFRVIMFCSHISTKLAGSALASGR